MEGISFKGTGDMHPIVPKVRGSAVQLLPPCVAFVDGCECRGPVPGACSVFPASLLSRDPPLFICFSGGLRKATK